MTIFPRTIEPKIQSLLFKQRAILIFGPRQVGKTTLAKKILAEHSAEDGYFNCDELAVRNYFKLGEPHLLKQLVGKRKIVIFDEAQTIQNIGKILKVFIDTYSDVQIITTGSSSFDLANKINEPLTGRAFEFTLYPLSLAEIRAVLPVTSDNLDDIIRLGSYPAIVGEQERGAKSSLLRNITTNYLYKDIFVFEDIKNPQIFEDLIKALALQIGNEVSVSELADTLKTTRQNIQKYLRLLEQAYIVKKVRSFSRNLRNELKKSFKVYFLDTGIRNAVLGKTDNILENRDDKGVLFENFFYAEILKHGAAQTFPPEIFFWRTRDQKEIDFLEIEGESMRAYECKWHGVAVAPEKFTKVYPRAVFKSVNFDTMLKNHT